jgi:hypothetical protein
LADHHHLVARKGRRKMPEDAEHVEHLVVNGSVHRGADPTALTREALNEAKEITREAVSDAKEVSRREDAVIRAEMLGTVRALQEQIGARLDGMDKATTLQLASALRYPNDIEVAVNGLRQLHNLDIDTIYKLLVERDKRFDIVDKAAQATQQLALAAPADAAARVEKATQADQLNNVRQFGQITARLDRIEGVTQGAETAAHKFSSNTTMLVTLLGTLLLATSVLIAILEATHR